MALENLGTASIGERQEHREHRRSVESVAELSKERAGESQGVSETHTCQGLEEAVQ